MINSNNFALGDECLTLQLSQLLQRLSPEVAKIVDPFLWRLLEVLRQGDSCLPLSNFETEIIAQAAPLVSLSGGVAPLILQKFEQKNYLYFATHWFLEQQLAARIVALSRKEDAVEARLASSILDELFSENSQQKLAAALALRKCFLLIAGGPGTGKTSTVVRLIAALIAVRYQLNQSHKPLNIVMAAPTGKAAARLSEALQRNLSHLKLSNETLSQMPQKSVTLHRLLGLRKDGESSQFNAERKLNLDVLIIDEASMVDLSLMTQTINALPDHARLILLGDPLQLSAVGVGSVLSDLCAFAGNSKSMSDWLHDVLALQHLPMLAENTPLADCVVTLQTSHRFRADSAIGQLASAVKNKDADLVIGMFDDLLSPDIFWAPSRADLVKSAIQHYQQYFLALDDGIAAAFTAFERFMFLCVEKKDVDYLNQQINLQLEALAQKQVNHDWYAGRAVMINKNDYSLSLFNGDIGLCLLSEDKLQVYFADVNGGYRAIAPERLYNIDSAFAMTVHKSQGSEFGQICLLLPEKNNSRLLERSLLYTALTRAKQAFSVCANAEILREAVLNDAKRISGLGEQILLIK